MPRLLLRRDLPRGRGREVLGQRVTLALSPLLARQPKAHGVIERLGHVWRPRPHLGQQGGVGPERHDRSRTFRLFRSTWRHFCIRILLLAPPQYWYTVIQPQSARQCAFGCVGQLPFPGPLETP
jgi:hypothetical protein